MSLLEMFRDIKDPQSCLHLLPSVVTAFVSLFGGTMDPFRESRHTMACKLGWPPPEGLREIPHVGGVPEEGLKGVFMSHTGA